MVSIPLGLFTLRSAPAAAAGECSTGYYPKITNIVSNGSFAIPPTDVAPAGSAGTSASTPGHYYANASFRSQMANAGHNIYPTDDPSNNGLDLRNVFSTQVGPFVGTPPHTNLNQVTFPGDPTYGVPGSNTWLYTNGNALAGTEYLTWEQDVTGLTPGQDYVFVAYISNVIEAPDDSPDDPTIRFRLGGTTGMPDGTVIGGPTVLTEAATANTQPLNGWQRVAFAFTATGTSEKLKITDASSGWWGDDFALTTIHLAECVSTPDYAAALSHSGSPSQYGSYTQRVTLSNAGATTPDGGHSVTVNLPTGYTVNGGSTGAVTLTSNTGNYSCTSDAATPQTLACTSPDPIPSGDSRQMEFAVAIGAGANASSTITASVSQPLDENGANDNASDPIVLAPDLRNSLTVDSHTETSVTLRANIENIGTYTTSGNDQVALTLPPGIIVNGGAAGPVTISGPNAADWTCTADAATPQVVTCLHPTSIRNLPADDQEYLITLQIDPDSTETSFDFASLVTATGDSNPSNNPADTTFTIGNTPSTPAPEDDDEPLADTGVDVLGSVLAAAGLLATGAVLLRKHL